MSRKTTLQPAQKKRKIEKAVRLIQPALDVLDDCRKEVEAQIDQITIRKLNREFLRIPGTKQAKRRVNRFVSAARRLVQAATELHDEFPLLCFEIFLARQNSNQGGDVLIDLDELDSHGYDRFMSDMKGLIDLFAPPPGPATSVPVDSCGVRRKIFANMKSGRPKRNSYEQRLATVTALYLLRKCSPFPVTTTKNGRFCKLAALLYGDPNANLQHYCRDVVGGGRRGRLAQRKSGRK